MFWGDRGPASGTAWPGIGDGVKPPPCPRLAPSVGQLGWLSSTLVFIYLPGEIPQAGPRRAPAQQKYSRNASDHSRASAGPQASGGRAGWPCVPLSTGTQVPAGCCPQGARPLWRGVAGFPVSHQGGMWDSHRVQGTFIIFPCLGSSWFGSFSALTEGLVLLWFPCVGKSQGVLGGGLCPVGSAMGQHVSAKFPGEGMTEICWPGRNAAVTKQLGWASQWRWLQSCATWGHLWHHRHSLLCYASLAKGV